MTTDFLLTRHSGTSTRYEAWCVKYEGDLLNRRTLQKLEIERLFWRKHDIPWRIVTERSLPRTVAANLQYLHPFLGLEPGSLLSTEQWQALTPLLFSRITQGVILAEIAEDIDKILRIPTGTTLQAVRFLMAKQMWPVDIRVPINFRKPLVLLPNQCLRRVE